MQYLNIMTELEINKLATMLSSDDIEIRKIAENIILENFDTNFYIHIYDNFKEIKLEISLDYINHFPYVYRTTKFMKEILKIVVLYPEYSIFCKDIINILFEYNDRIRNK